MSQQSLFDDDKSLDEHRRDHPGLVGRESLPHDADPVEHGRQSARKSSGGTGSSGSDVSDYMEQKREEELRERDRADLPTSATAGAHKVAVLRWAINAEDPDLPSDAIRAASRCKGRLDALEQASRTTDPSDPEFVALRDSAYDAWPFDDEPMLVPTSSTRRSEYEAFLASEWMDEWKFFVPVEVIKDAKSSDPSFL